MKGSLKKESYTRSIALVIISFTLLPCLILGGIYLKKAHSEWKEDILSEHQNEVDFNALFISKNITELQLKMQYLLNNVQIRSHLSRLNTMPIHKALDFVDDTEEAVYSMTAANENLEIRWYPYSSPYSYGSYCFVMERFTSEFPLGTEDPGYQAILALKEGNLAWQVRDVARGENNRGTVETRLCLYSQISTRFTPDCILELSVPVTDIALSPQSHLTQDSLFALCLEPEDNDTVDIVLSTPFSMEESQALLAQYHAQGALEHYDIIRASIPNVTQGEVLFFVPKAYVSGLIVPQIATVLIIAVLVILLILIACYTTSRLLTRRVLHAINLMNSDLNQTLKEPLDLEGQHDDIGQIALKVRQLVRDSQEYCLRIERYEAENFRMELELLQLRFNPHLLYNTLDAIYYQVKSARTKQTIHALCSYYRIVLNNGHLVIHIQDELNMIKEYLSIVKFAYGLDDIVCEFEIDEQITQYAIIKHLLQPIVENALNHGIRPAKRNGILKIQMFSEEDIIRICVVDNGLGMSIEDAAQLLKGPSASVSKGGYGIYNVQQRIQLYYGKEYGLSIESVPGEGTTVTMKIPKVLPE